MKTLTGDEKYPMLPESGHGLADPQSNGCSMYANCALAVANARISG